jgi:hypothetical protein
MVGACSCNESGIILFPTGEAAMTSSSLIFNILEGSLAASYFCADILCIHGYKSFFLRFECSVQIIVWLARYSGYSIIMVTN